MSCPYFEEVVMVYCRAYPVRKLIPRSQSLAGTRCLGDCFDRCPFFQEIAEPSVGVDPPALSGPASSIAANETRA